MNFKDAKTGRSELHYAVVNFEHVEYRQSNIVRILLEKGASTDILDKYGKTPFEYSPFTQELVGFKIEKTSESPQLQMKKGKKSVKSLNQMRWDYYT